MFDYYFEDYYSTCDLDYSLIFFDNERTMSPREYGRHIINDKRKRINYGKYNYVKSFRQNEPYCRRCF